ncbi:MAG: hypothetical protein R3E58_10310 [Phycisphaerae bacterium]
MRSGDPTDGEQGPASRGAQCGRSDDGVRRPETLKDSVELATSIPVRQKKKAGTNRKLA